MKLLYCLLMMCCLACNENVKENTKMENAPKAVAIFPVSSFFSEQVKNVETLQLPTVKYTNGPSGSDTVSIEMKEFKSLAREFIETDISNTSVSRYYKESSFADQSLPSVTFTYSTTNVELPVQRMDVILQPNAVGDEKVSTVYIEKKELLQDTITLKKLYWKADKNFQVITSKQVKGKPEIIKQLKVAWDNSDAY